ncbi:sigma-70 family RNA polymerase sigma factor [Nitriliruptoraceae bacterium ZYF776]|nr:sigma-70 family RNA polymerase sigma factor [Profundirhabdus halotolerans]
MTEPSVPEDLLRTLAPQVLGAVVRRYGHLELAEEALQEAALRAVERWPRDGLPDDPRAWLIRVTSRVLIDQLRSETARRRREERTALADRGPAEPRSAGAAQRAGGDAPTATAAWADQAADPQDDSLLVLFLCCHPSLTDAARIALTLRAVGGLTTAEIASALLLPEATVGQRITRAKRTLRGEPLRRPGPDDLPGRLRVVLHVLYLVFTEGHTASGGDDLQRVDLAEEAIRLARLAHAALPEDEEVGGLLALMLLTHARRGARVDADGLPVALEDQDRARWDAAAIAEGAGLLEGILRRGGPIGPYQVQAAIATLHDEAPTADRTDWRQILGLYELLESLDPDPVVTLNRTVAVARVHGPAAGLRLLDTVAADRRLAGHRRLDVVRGHLLAEVGDRDGAVAALRRAAASSTNSPERRYLLARAARLADPVVPAATRERTAGRRQR